MLQTISSDKFSFIFLSKAIMIALAMIRGTRARMGSFGYYNLVIRLRCFLKMNCVSEIKVFVGSFAWEYPLF